MVINKMNYMKKIIRTILYAVVFAVLAVSCQEENNEVEPIANTKENIEISINGLMGEYTQVDVTKAELVNNVRVSWKGGETVFVFDGTECIGSLIASLDENGDDRYALLSPMGISFVSKVAPPKLKGTMMGGWFVATAVGNMLVSVGGFLWGGLLTQYHHSEMAGG